MKPPYYRLTSRCKTPSCQVDQFTTERKKVQKIDGDGRLYTTTNQVCTTCKCWGSVIQIEEVPTTKGATPWQESQM